MCEINGNQHPIGKVAEYLSIPPRRAYQRTHPYSSIIFIRPREKGIPLLCTSRIIMEKIMLNRFFILYSALLISDFWYLFFKPTWFQRSTSNFRWIREDIRAK